MFLTNSHTPYTLYASQQLPIYVPHLLLSQYILKRIRGLIPYVISVSSTASSVVLSEQQLSHVCC